MKTMLSLFVFCWFGCYAHCAAQTVFIYDGPGVSRESLKQTELAAKRFLPLYTIELIGPAQVLENPWEERAALFILPGGADIPYTEALNGVGNQRIKNYVANGGAFLGICAGSYYAGAFVDFAKNTPLEVQGDRELAFFPGVVRGPILAQYDYRSQSGARAARLTWGSESGFAQNEQFAVFYNGGGYFVDASNYPNTSVLAAYDIEKSLPAIIQCQVGERVAVLSGVHFEYDPFLLDAEDPHLRAVLPPIAQENEHRERLLMHLLERLLQEEPRGSPRGL